MKQVIISGVLAGLATCSSAQLQVTTYPLGNQSVTNFFQAFDGIYGSATTGASGKFYFKLTGSGTLQQISSLATATGVAPTEVGIYDTISDVWYVNEPYYNKYGSPEYFRGLIDKSGTYANNLISDTAEQGLTYYYVAHNSSFGFWELVGSPGGANTYLNIFNPGYKANLNIPIVGGAYTEPRGVLLGPDSRMYVFIAFRSATEQSTSAPMHNALLRMNTDGSVNKTFDLDSVGLGCSAAVSNFTVGPDGNLWGFCGKVLDLRTGAPAASLPTLNGTVPANPQFGPDGNLWTIGNGSYKALSASNGTTLYSGAIPYTYTTALFAGNDGKMWASSSTSSAQNLLSISGFAIGSPSNDNFANSLPLSGNSGSVGGFPFKASAETGEPSHTGSAPLRSLWWNWTAPANGLLMLNTAGSSPKAAVAVYTGTSVSSLTPQTANSRSFQHVLGVYVTAGVNYKIAVDNFDSLGVKDVVNYSFISSPQASLTSALTTNVSPDGSTVYSARITSGGNDYAIGNTARFDFAQPVQASALPSFCTAASSTSIVCTVRSMAPGEFSDFRFTLAPMLNQTVSGTLSLSTATGSGTTSPSQPFTYLDVWTPPGQDAPIPEWSLVGVSAGVLGLTFKRYGKRRAVSSKSS